MPHLEWIKFRVIGQRRVIFTGGSSSKTITLFSPRYYNSNVLMYGREDHQCCLRSNFGVNLFCSFSKKTLNVCVELLLWQPIKAISNNDSGLVVPRKWMSSYGKNPQDLLTYDKVNCPTQIGDETNLQ